MTPPATSDGRVAAEKLLEPAGHVSEGDRPSAHGARLGRALAAMVEAGGEADMCATCAFREGSMPNLMAGTGLAAMHCAIGADPSPFGCHHGMEDGQPTRPCAGYLAARQAPFEAWQGALENVLAASTDGVDDPIRADFERWWPTIDPDKQMDVYQLGRAWSRARAEGVRHDG